MAHSHTELMVVLSDRHGRDTTKCLKSSAVPHLRYTVRASIASSIGIECGPKTQIKHASLSPAMRSLTEFTVGSWLRSSKVRFCLRESTRCRKPGDSLARWYHPGRRRPMAQAVSNGNERPSKRIERHTHCASATLGKRAMTRSNLFPGGFSILLWFKAIQHLGTTGNGNGGGL